MGPLSVDAIRRDAADRLPDPEVRTEELLQGPPHVASRRPLDPRRVWRALQRHYYLPARIFVDEYQRDIRRVARSDQRAWFLLPRFCLFHLRVTSCLGAGADVDHRARWTEKLWASVFIYACKGLHQ